MSELQDTLHFAVRAEQVVVNTTVKLIAIVIAMVAGETSESDLRAEIKATMRKLVDDDWQFSNMQRGADASGYERVTLTATVRVSETENYNLDERAKAASRKGLTITQVAADTTVPPDMLEAAESDLRITLLKKIMAEKAKFETALGMEYRLHTVEFSVLQNLSRTSNAVMAASAKVAYGTGFSNDDETLGNASKLTLTASAQLARLVLNTPPRRLSLWGSGKPVGG